MNTTHSTEIPHRRAHGMCPVNPVRDLVHWRAGRDWSNEFVYGLGQGGGFAYLRFSMADPPRQVYWGVAGPRQHQYLADLFDAGYTVVEKRSFKFSWRRAREALDASTPPVLGPLDMFYLHYYEGLYRQRHIPIHYVLLVGYDDENAYVLDTDQDDVQVVPLAELQPAWDVNVPGLGKPNRLVVFDIPQDLPPTDALIRKSIADQCQTMLEPPVSMVGIPAMRKLAHEIAGWSDELGEDVAAACLRQVREYLNAPPDLEGDRLTAGRDLYIAFLEEAGPLAGLDLSAGIGRLRESVATIPHLAEAIWENRLEEAAAHVRHIAEQETAAYAAFSRQL
jgi:hypothetical protein